MEEDVVHVLVSPLRMALVLSAIERVSRSSYTATRGKIALPNPFRISPKTGVRIYA